MTAKAPIGLFYGSSTCYTEMAGEKIQQAFSQTPGAPAVDTFNITDTPIVEAGFYDFIIFGIPTWDYGELQEDWEEIWDDIDELDLTGKKVAVYGMGDQEGYPEWFVDAMGYLYHKARKCGAEMVGHWPNQGYEFEASKALTTDQSHFVGLALDDETQFEQSDDRIRQWVAQLHHEFGL
ncbi:MAG: flavodoxin FldB [Candidatus Pelagadaptatus aseana]|uniref:flavodoxin FldB n=1 Tax=Candidatus Pelagadaptatus aseana TaxID=3120508 RepID=UPI0039B13583